MNGTFGMSLALPALFRDIQNLGLKLGPGVENVAEGRLAGMESPYSRAASNIHWPVALRSAADALNAQWAKAARLGNAPPGTWRTYGDYLRAAQRMTEDVARGLPKYAARIPGASALNALDLAPIPQSLVQRMLSYGQGPQT